MWKKTRRTLSTEALLGALLFLLLLMGPAILLASDEQGVAPHALSSSLQGGAGEAPHASDLTLTREQEREKAKEEIEKGWTTDREKPRPDFVRKGEEIIAELVPRGKSGKVKVEFQVSGGSLVDVQGVDFETARRQEVDAKDFRYALFAINIAGLAPGGQAKILLRSDFFSPSTGYGIFNERVSPAWTKAAVENSQVAGRLRQMSFQVTDGGPLDSDGADNGRITVVGGPMDSFWGYAIGTLVIRFFGVFVVLVILQIGMLVSGRFFIARKNKQDIALGKPGLTDVTEDLDLVKADRGTDTQRPEPEVLLSSQAEPSAEEAAAITLALHLYSTAHPAPVPGPSTTHPPRFWSCPMSGSWTMSGRERIMRERSRVFTRVKH
jgi:hypothetical protein